MTEDRFRARRLQRPGYRPEISIVAPCFNEEHGLPEFCRRAAASCKEVCGEDYEIVLVDDGSNDGSWDVVRRLAAFDRNVVGVRLMRNHGHQVAASAGLALARGNRVLLIDADLQDPPELLGRMMQAMDEEKADVVFGQRAARHGETRFKVASAILFYRFLSCLAAVPIPGDAGDFRLMCRRVVDALSAMPERQRFIRGMVSWVGGRQVPLLYERQARLADVSNYSLTRMMGLALDAVTGFSTVPLRLAAWLGFGSALAALGLFVATIWGWAAGNTLLGWSSIMTTIVSFGAVQLIVLGILGEYVGRLFQEAKQRPLYLVDEILAEGRSLAIPSEFSNLSPSVRWKIWGAAREEVSTTRSHIPSLLGVESSGEATRALRKGKISEREARAKGVLSDNYSRQI
jgi:glycosyltransferase involved in cell wall biosynthesis